VLQRVVRFSVFEMLLRCVAMMRHATPHQSACTGIGLNKTMSRVSRQWARHASGTHIRVFSQQAPQNELMVSNQLSAFQSKALALIQPGSSSQSQRIRISCVLRFCFKLSICASISGAGAGFAAGLATRKQVAPLRLVHELPIWLTKSVQWQLSDGVLGRSGEATGRSGRGTPLVVPR